MITPVERIPFLDVYAIPEFLGFSSGGFASGGFVLGGTGSGGSGGTIEDDPFTPPVIPVLELSDMPLEQAEYSPATDKIIGVRGQWLFEFNATTGALLRTLRWANDVFVGQSTLVQVGGFIYVASTSRIVENTYTTPMYSQKSRDVFKIDPVSFSVVSQLGLYRYMSSVADYNQQWIADLITDGTYIFGQVTGEYAFRVNTDGTGHLTASNLFGSFVASKGLAYDFVNNCIWGTDSATNQVNVIPSTWPTFDQSYSDPSGSSAYPTFGLCVYPVGTKVYCASGTPKVQVIDGSGVFPTFVPAPWTTLTLSDPLATPIRIRYNPYNGMIYVPTWQSDKVIIIDPATGLEVATMTGFSAPVDIVFTPTKTFAVQNGNGTALKEVTGTYGPAPAPDVTPALTVTAFQYQPDSGDSSGTMMCSFFGGRPPYTFKWEDAANLGPVLGTSAFLGDVPAASYQLTITDSVSTTASSTGVLAYVAPGLQLSVMPSNTAFIWSANSGFFPTANATTLADFNLAIAVGDTQYGVGSLSFTDPTQPLTAISNLDAYPNLTTLVIYSSAITTFAITNCRRIGYLDARNTPLTVAAVNGILADLVTGGRTFGSLRLDAARIAAISGSGVADKATLLSRGWTISSSDI